MFTLISLPSPSTRTCTCSPPTEHSCPMGALSRCRRCREVCLARGFSACGAGVSVQLRRTLGGASQPHAWLVLFRHLSAQRSESAGRGCRRAREARRLHAARIRCGGGGPLLADSVNSQLSQRADRREIPLFSKGRFRRVWATAAPGELPTLRRRSYQSDSLSASSPPVRLSSPSQS